MGASTCGSIPMAGLVRPGVVAMPCSSAVVIILWYFCIMALWSIHKLQSIWVCLKKHPQKKKLPNLNKLVQTPHARETMGFTLFFVSEVKIQICIHMAINYKRLQIIPVWNHMADSLDNLLEKWSHNVICILLASKTPGDWLQLETSIHK